MPGTSCVLFGAAFPTPTYNIVPEGRLRFEEYTIVLSSEAVLKCVQKLHLAAVLERSLRLGRHSQVFLSRRPVLLAYVNIV